MSPIAVLCSMEQEMRSIEAHLTEPIESAVRGQRFISGKLAETLVTTAISGYGKVAAAATTGLHIPWRALRSLPLHLGPRRQLRRRQLHRLCFIRSRTNHGRHR